MGILDRLLKKVSNNNNTEIERINKDVAQMSEAIVIHMSKILHLARVFVTRTSYP